MHSPNSPRRSATVSHTSALREEMYTRTPERTRPSAIMRPMPLLPPVTSATLPVTEKSDETSIR